MLFQVDQAGLREQTAHKSRGIKKTGFLASLALARCQCQQIMLRIESVSAGSFRPIFPSFISNHNPPGGPQELESGKPQRLWEQTTAVSECVSRPSVIVAYQSHPSLSFYPDHMWSHLVHSMLVLEPLLQSPMRSTLHLQKSILEGRNNNYRMSSLCREVAYKARVYFTEQDYGQSY